MRRWYTSRVRLEDVDFNLLRALHALLETRSVTRAARRLGVTQPSMSRTLGRLREALGDPLFVSSGRALAPTAFALGLAPEVERALWALRMVFDPTARAGGEDGPLDLRVAASDYGVLRVIRPLLARRDDAPAVAGLRVVQLAADSIGALHRGELDLALAPHADLPGFEDLVLRPLVDDEHALVVRRGHALARGRATLESYLEGVHVMVENAAPGLSAVQRALAKLGRSRRVGVRVPSLLGALALVAETDLVASLPAAFARASGLPLAIRPLPFAVDRLELKLVFHTRWTNDPRHQRVRRALVEAARDAPRVGARGLGVAGDPA